jgi:eukaryotic-like serine/threonine-protein kinase
VPSYSCLFILSQLVEHDMEKPAVPPGKAAANQPGPAPAEPGEPTGDLQDSSAGDTAVFEGRKAGEADEATLVLREGELAAQAKKAALAPAMKTATLGDYKLLKKLGQGGMGAVYRAHQASLDREVAIKVLSKDLAARPGFVQRFLREARVMAKLDHPNILRCYEVGEAMGYHFIAMEFVEGGSIDSWLAKLKRFDIGDALCVVITVARALEHAHEQGLVHRDIKPDNILLTKKGVIKVADLGLAKASDDDLGLTRTGTGAGTPLYMAPEQARDAKHVDGRCDIYALGVMLYVFLTGQAPFGGTTIIEVVEAKEKGKFKPIRMYNPEVPDRLDLIVDKMLAKDPKLRFATCTEVVDELDGLGLANDRLSFFEGAGPVSGVKAAPTRTPAAAAARTQQPVPASTAAPKSGTAPPGPAHAKAEPNIWYWSFKDPKGQPIIKKITTEELATLVKSGSIDSKAQISKTREGGYRAIATYPEFESHFRGKIAEKRAGRGAEQYRSMLEQIEQEDQRRRRMKWLKGIFGKFGSAVGLIIWLAVLGVALVGGYFGVMWLLERMR